MRAAADSPSGAMRAGPPPAAGDHMPVLLLAAGVAAVAAAGAVALGADVGTAYLGATVAVAGAGLASLALRVEPAWPLSLGVAASMFSGHSELLGSPLPPDRLLLAVGLIALYLQRAERPALRLEPVHWALLAAAAWAILSAARVGSLTETDGLFTLLDSFGLVPFAMFLAAPVAFRTARQRTILLAALVCTGGYLGVTALAEALGADAFVFPNYILDDSVGLHADRARGPFVEAVANGLGLFGGAVAAVVASACWRDPAARLACAAVTLLCAAGVVFTLTRGIWLAAAVATVVTLAAFRTLRPKLIPVAATAAGVVALVLAFVPGLADDASEREADQAPIWVRENTNRAALEMVAQQPVSGVGWARYEMISPAYFEQAGDTPLEGVGEGVHNVFLSHASELGLVGAFLWTIAVVWAIGGSLWRRVAPQLEPWRMGLAALTLAWVVVAAVTPLPYAMPTLVLFLWAGVLRSVRTQVDGPPPPAMRR